MPGSTMSSEKTETKSSIQEESAATTLSPSPKDTEAAISPERASEKDAPVNDESQIPDVSGEPLGRVKTLLGARPDCFKSTLQEVLFVFMTIVATASTSFLTGVSSIITASVGRDLGMTQSEISWMNASVNLTAGAFQLALGQLADLLGRKMMFLTGLSSFSLFAVILGFAKNPFWMDIILGFMGISSAMVVPPAIGILGAAYAKPSKRKNLAFSAFSAGNPLGFVLGSIFCGIAAKLFDWRAAFWLIAILWAAFTALGFYAIPNVEAFEHTEPLKVRLGGFLKQFDTVGAILTLFGTGLFTAAITLGPSDGWKSPHVIAMLVVGLVLLVVFFFWERTYAFPLMPPHIWRDRNFSFILLTAILGFMSFTSAAFWLSYFMQQAQGLAPLTVAVHLIPQCIAGLTWNIIAGHILHKVNNTFIMAFGAVAYIVANLLLALMKLHSSYWAFIFPSLIIQVVGADFQFNVANMYVMQSLPSHQQSLAGGIFNTMIRLSSSVSMGITTAVYSSVANTPQGIANPMLKFTRAWDASLALSAASVVGLPFIRLGTQGNSPPEESLEESETTLRDSNDEKRA